MNTEIASQSASQAERLGTSISSESTSNLRVRTTDLENEDPVFSLLALKLVRMQAAHSATLEMLTSSKSKQRVADQELAAEIARRQIAERSERSMLAKLEFKEAAMREIDHRAKNTLQVVGNLLAVQSRMTANPEARDVLQEAYRRLHVLARLHELLFVGQSDARVVQVSALLDSLGEALRQSFGERSAEIELRLVVEPIALPESMAIPLALLANELVTNAYKHAFPNGARGKIELTLKRAAEGITLQVSDNGVGVRSANEGSGLGLKLIRSFSAHLKGALTYSEPSMGSSGMTATVTISPTACEEIESRGGRATSPTNPWEAAL